MPSHHTPLPWKKRFRKVPTRIAAVLAGNPAAAAFSVGVLKRLPRAEIAGGGYRHVCITAVDVEVVLPRGGFVPSPNVGPASFANAVPVEQQVKALGKVPKRIRGRAPNWQGSGTHATTYVRDVWFTRLAVPAMTPLLVQAAGEVTPEEVPVRFQLGEVLFRHDPAFEAALLRCLNLLQENVGAVDVWPVDAGDVAALPGAVAELGWAPLPPPGLSSAAQSRLAMLSRLAPRRLWFSTCGLPGVVWAEFTDDLAVFVHLDAAADWLLLRGPGPALPALTRAGLRARLAGEVERVPDGAHTAERLRDVVQRARGEYANGQIALL